VSESDRLERIVADFLRLTRQPGPEPVAVAMKPFLHDCCQQLRHAERLQPLLRLSAEVADGTPSARVDPDHLRQVVVNLVTNAMQAIRTEVEPEIHIDARPGVLEDGRRAVELRITDNGPGIPTAQHERVFTPFFSTKPQGTGLGLTVVQRLVRANEGVISIERPAHGGTCIRVCMPAEEPREAGG
ncbi:MAG: sensor histidine kinase, partial [Planctomycetota bacterium]